MLSPIITEYIAADRTDEAHRRADRARLVREVRIETREARHSRKGNRSATPSGGGPGLARPRPAPSDQPDCSPDEERADHQQPAALGQLELPEPRVRLDRLPQRVAVTREPVGERVRAWSSARWPGPQAVRRCLAEVLSVGCLDPAADDPAGPAALIPA